MLYAAPAIGQCNFVSPSAAAEAPSGDGAKGAPAVELCPTGRLLNRVAPRLVGPSGSGTDSRPVTLTLGDASGGRQVRLEGVCFENSVHFPVGESSSGLEQFPNLMSGELRGVARCVVAAAIPYNRHPGHPVSILALDPSSDFVTTKLIPNNAAASLQKLAHLRHHWVSVIANGELIVGRVGAVYSNHAELLTPSESIVLDSKMLKHGANIMRMAVHARVDARNQDPTLTLLQLIQKFERGTEVELKFRTAEGLPPNSLTGRFLEVTGTATPRPLLLLENPVTHEVLACPLYKVQGCFNFVSLETSGYQEHIAAPFWAGRLTRGTQIAGDRRSNVPKELMVVPCLDSLRDSGLS